MCNKVLGYNNKKTKFNLFEDVYICKYYERIKLSDLAKGLNSTPEIIQYKVQVLKEKDLYDEYKRMPDSTWEQLEKTRKRKVFMDE